MTSASTSSRTPGSGQPLVALFDDSHIAKDCHLAPIADLRAAFDIRTGAWTTLERVRRRLGRVDAVFVPPELDGVTRERHPGVAVNPGAGEWVKLAASGGRGENVLLLNGRAPLAHMLTGSLGPGQGVVDAGSGALVAALMPAAKAHEIVAGKHGGLLNITSMPTGATLALLSRPWHVRTLRDACLGEDLNHEIDRLVAVNENAQLPPTTVCMGDRPWFVHRSASVLPNVVLDTTAGPILIDGEATIRPGATLCGPCYVGPHASVLDRAIIRPGTSIGPWCKVAGEVGGTIFEGFSNKGHDGYLGDSYIGEWVNLGAGTTNSNLLNTYGEVIARPLVGGKAGSNERTGETFLGCVLGDHVKTAICTRIMTGSIVGTGTMFAATAALSGTVPAFSWCTDAAAGDGGKAGVGIKPYRFDKFLEVARAAMARRKVTPGTAYAERLRMLAGA